MNSKIVSIKERPNFNFVQRLTLENFDPMHFYKKEDTIRYNKNNPNSKDAGSLSLTQLPDL